MTPADRIAIGDDLFAGAIRATLTRAGRPIVVGLSGAQGSGKSTLSQRLSARLADEGLAIVTRSLDDFYLTRADRERLAMWVHPLLRTRGVPGTHDVALIEATIATLLTGAETPLPSFDKSIDDRRDHAEWPVHRGAVDVVLIEGWCVGARPQPAHLLNAPVNDLERAEDADGRWRSYVNAQLDMDYAALWRRFDLRLMVRAPDFADVFAWRAQQEAGLDRGAGSQPPMTAEQLRRFIAHYERLTRWMMEDEPADLIADVDADRAPLGWRLSPAS